MSYLGVPPFGQTVRTITETLATAGQSTFTPSGGYLPGYIDVFLNGSALGAADFTATNGSTVVLNVAAALNDEFKAIAYWPVSLIDTYRKSEADALLATKQAASNVLTTYVSTGVEFRNRIINGNMSVWQRGTSFASPGNITYTADRWFIGLAGSNLASAARVAGPAGFQYALQITGAAGNTTTQVNQRIESVNTYDLVGQPATIQAVLQSSSAMTIGWTLFYANATDNFGSLTVISSGTWSATTSATLFTATTAVLPAGAANGLMLLITPNNSAAFTSGTLTITGVQLEAGTVATPFERRDYGRELVMCQRYYERRTVGSTNNERLATTGLSNGSTTAQFPIQHLVQKRASPSSINVGNLSSTATYDGTGSGIPTSWGLDNTGIFITNIQLFGLSTALGRAIHWTWNNVSPLPYIEINSEL